MLHESLFVLEQQLCQLIQIRLGRLARTATCRRWTSVCCETKVGSQRIRTRGASKRRRERGAEELEDWDVLHWAPVSTGRMAHAKARVELCQSCANGFQADLGAHLSAQVQEGRSEFGHCKFQVINFTVLDEVGVMNGKAHLQQQLAETRGFPAINKALSCRCSRSSCAPTCEWSRFHTVMRHFGIPEPQAAENSEANNTPRPSHALPTPRALTRQAAGEACEHHGRPTARRPLQYQGVDSMMAIELQQKLRLSGIEVSLDDLQSEEPLADLLTRMQC
eukprot:s1142_g9.t1